MLPVPIPSHSVAEYLALERVAEHRSELIDGQIVAMAGASRSHSLIAVNLGRELSTALRGQSCETYDSDMRVKVAASGLYTYPDLSIVCGEPDFEDEAQDTLTNPTVIFEILSPSTEAYDRGEKFARYRQLSSLREYVLVSQDRPRIERFTRAGERWVLTAVEGLDQALVMDSLRCTLNMRDVYERVGFDSSGPGVQESPSPG